MAFDFIVGEPFPAFELPGVARRDSDLAVVERLVSNQMLRGKSFVLWVFPKAHTSGCTLEAREFAALFNEFGHLGVEVVGLSRDSLAAASKFSLAQGLLFPLMCDKNGVWLCDHGLIFEAKMYGKPVTKVARTTFLVDGQGITRRVWEQVAPSGHGALVLDAARELARLPNSA